MQQPPDLIVRGVRGASVALLLAGLTSCAGGRNRKPGVSGAATVSGHVTYLQRIALPPDAVLEVSLQDVSQADTPAQVLVTQHIATQGKQVPIPFALTYDPAAIDPAHTYVLRAQLDFGGGRLFGSTEAVPVITRGNPDQVEIVVRLLQ
jgi:putative lipoprotein